MKDQVFGVGYRRLPERSRRWVPWPIARTALSLAWRKRSTKFGLVLCSMSVFGHGMALTAQILAERFTQAAPKGAGPMAQTFIKGIVGDVHTTLANFIGVQMVACAFLLAMVAAPLIAEDRRTGAMELYFSRPLRHRDYLLGKLLAAGMVPIAVMVVPFFLLWLFAVGMAPPGTASELLWLLPPGLLGVTVATVLLTTTILGLSAVGERGRTVGVLYVVGMLMLTFLGEQLPQAGHRWAGYLSPSRNIQTLADSVLDAGGSGMLLSMLTNRPSVNPSLAIAMLCVAGLCVAGMGLLMWRVRKEVSG